MAMRARGEGRSERERGARGRPGWAPASAAVAAAAVVAATGCGPPDAPPFVDDPAGLVDTRIGTAGGGNTFPGAVVPFGMVQWSPEMTRGDPTQRPAPGGYEYGATRVRGFSLTHLSGTGCRGASGDVPFMPIPGEVTSSPSADTLDRRYTGRLSSHANETAVPGYYQLRLRSGLNVELTATRRTGSGRFTYPPGEPAAMLVRMSDSEVGSGDARVEVIPESRVVTGSVTSGNFCAYIDGIDSRSYYTLHFWAVFDRPFSGHGSWEDGAVDPGGTEARGGTGYGPEGVPVAGRGSGAWVEFETGDAPTTVGVRVGISYVSRENARANLEAENPGGTPFDAVRTRAREAWSRELRRIRIAGGTPGERRTFYTALYHVLLHPNVFSDVNGEYRGFDGEVHAVEPPQEVQYANFSGWDVYRSQLQLVTLLRPGVAGDIARSLHNQAMQHGGVWDRWTHNSGPTGVMTGDPSAPAVAGIHAFGGTGFDVEGAFESLVRAATVPTPRDLSDEGCPVGCLGQRPSLDRWLEIHYIPAGSHAWGGAGETLEAATADFALSQLARRLGRDTLHRRFLERSGYWRNVFNPDATAGAGYVQDRRADGSWTDFDPASRDGFAEGSSAQYTWMVPFDPRGLFEAMGGPETAARRLDGFFHNPDGSRALTGLGGMRAEMDNEPSIGAPWLYLFAGEPHRTQATVRAIVNRLWRPDPDGIPGNDDLGAMSSWYVWAAMGMYPGIPGRAELLLASPLFPAIEVRRVGGPTLEIRAPGADAHTPYVRELRVDGEATTRPWLPESFVREGGELRYRLSATPDTTWGAAPDDAPPSFGPSPVTSSPPAPPAARGTEPPR